MFLFIIKQLTYIVKPYFFRHPDAEIGFNGNIQRTIQRAKEGALPRIQQIVEEADRLIREHDRFR